MAAFAPHDTNAQNIPITQTHTLFASFTNFLTVAIHTIIYHRSIYPKTTFLSAKAYNLPVQQSRHPKVCAWIRDAVDAVMAQIAAGAASRMAVVIHAPLHEVNKSTSPSPKTVAPGAVLERWMFDLSSLPAWPGGMEAFRNFRGEQGDKTDDDNDEEKVEEMAETGAEDEVEDTGQNEEAAPGSTSINWTDVDEQLRGALTRLAHAGEKMDSLPQRCTFTVAVELRDEAKAPIGHPQPWIPSQPSLQTSSAGPSGQGRYLSGAGTVPVRSVAAGPLFFECWVEEGKAKEALRAQASQDTSAS